MAKVDDFVAGDDGLETKWDGRSDNGEDLPAGKYRGRGYAVGNLKAEPVPGASPSTDDSGTPAVKVRLTANPLFNDERTTIEVGIGFDEQGCFLKTAEGLPIFTVASVANVTRASLKKAGEKAVDAWFESAGAPQQLRISNVNKMMAFDCGDLVLK